MCGCGGGIIHVFMWHDEQLMYHKKYPIFQHLCCNYMCIVLAV